MDEIVVFLMREFGWTLDYTVDLVKRLEIGRLNALLNETYFQKREEEYKIASNFAMALATWANSQSKQRFRIQSFIGNPPKRSKTEPDVSLYDAAKRAGIEMPKEK